MVKHDHITSWDQLTKYIFRLIKVIKLFCDQSSNVNMLAYKQQNIYLIQKAILINRLFEGSELQLQVSVEPPPKNERTAGLLTLTA